MKTISVEDPTMPGDSSDARMQNVNKSPPAGRQVFGRGLTWTGAIISSAGLIGAVGMISLLLLGVLEVPWDGGRGVLLAAASLCLLAMIGFIISLTALCVQRDLWAIMTFMLSIVVGFVCLLNIALVVLLGMAANPV